MHLKPPILRQRPIDDSQFETKDANLQEQLRDHCPPNLALPRTAEMAKALLAGDDQIRGQPQKEAVLHDASASAQPGC